MPSNISAGRFTVMDVNQPSTIKAANIDINNNIIGASCLSLILKKYDNIVIIIVVSVLISSLVINIVEY
jgi:hypothetical protein